MLVFSRPEHLDDLAPPQAAAIAHCRARALEWLAAHDYQLVIPPLADYLETLTGGDEDLNRQTFKITDTLSGRTLGIRADQTPQIARFDAGLHEKPAVRRYCYCGATLRTTPPQPWQGREGLQLGAELFGAPAGGGDWEIASVAMGALRAMGLDAGAEDLCMDVGHAGLFAEITAPLPPALRQALTQEVGLRDAAAVRARTARGDLSAETGAALLQLTQGSGGAEVLAAARPVLSAAHATLAPALDVLDEVQQRLVAEGYDCGISLSDLGSYGYHSGVVFSIYARDRLIARGGRYQQRNGDEGTGFSIDLRAVYPLIPAPESAAAVNVPWQPALAADAQWRAAVDALRAQNRRLRFVYDAPGDLPPPALQQDGKKWTVREK